MPEAPQIPAANFQITPDLRLGEGGEAEKFRDNIAAIKALKAIEAGNRRATAEEQRILARYVGWGGIPNAFPSPGTKEFKSEWKARGEELLGLLTPQEHRKASGSTTDAHYTSETVTTAIWDGVKRLGYRGGLALEMSLGSGNFIGLMPQDVSGRTRFIGVELDSITARIARALYPQATVLESGMQYVPLADNGFDLDIGNPPFGDTSLTWQHKPGLRGMSIHNQFFVAGLEALKPGGIQAKVVSRYLLDAMDPAARTALAKKGKLLAAIRLPETAFKTNARTSVVTDIVFIQRLTPAEEQHMARVFDAANGKPEKKPEDERARQALAQEVPAWVKTVEVRDPLGGEPMKVNHYFRANPDMIVGTMDRSGSMAHGNDITVKLDKAADFGAELAKRIARLPEGVALREDAAIDASIERYKSMADALEIYVSGQEPGQLVVGPDNKLLQVFERETPEGDYELAKREITPISPWSPHLLMDGKGQWYREVVKLGADGKPEKQPKKDGTPSNLNVVTREVFGGDDKVPESLRLGPTRFEQLRDIAALRDLLKKQLVLEAQDDTAGKMEANRKDLAAAYDAYVAKHGFVSNGTTSRLVNDMPDGALVQALELSYKAPITAKQAAKTGDKAREASVKRAPILSRRVVVPYAPPGRAATPADAMQISLSERGLIDVDRIAALRGLSVEEVEAELTDGESPLAFHDPELKRLETRNAYLTGEVARKLRAAKDAGLARNVDALQKVQPAPITSDNVTVIIGNTWVPSEVYAQFVQHITGEPAQVSYEPLTNTRTVRGTNSTKSKEWAARNESGNVTVEAVTLLQDAMNSETTKVYYRDIDGVPHLHKEDTELAAVKRGEIEREFTEWAFADATRRRLLVDKFNEKFNTRVTRQHDGSHLTLPGKVPDQVISMRRHQKNAIWRGIAERFMLLDHVVGAGKTYTAIARVMERRRMGLSAKPMIVVPNHMVEQFAADVYRLYPGAKVLAAGKSDFEKRARRRLFAKIATGDWDVVVVPHSSFGFIGLSPETEDAFLQDELRQALKAMKDAEAEAPPGRFKSLGVKKAEALVKKIEARIDAIRGDKKDRLLSFEQMGVDDLTVDEAHEFKNLFYSTRMSDVRGMGNASGSQKAFDLYTKVRYLRTTPTGSVVFMTGTPISNSAVEMYTMMRYLAADELRDLGLEHFDAWRTQFVDASTGYEQQLTGGVKEVGRLGRTWGNARSLMDLYYSFTDAVTIEDIKTAFAEDNPGKVFPVPKVKGGERQQIVVQPSPALLETLKQIFDDYDNLPNIQDPKVRNADRLRLMDRARKASLDLRAVDPTTTSKEEGGKLDRVADEVARIHKKWTPDRGAQMIFLDRSVPKSKSDQVLLKAYDKAEAARDKALADNNEEAYREAIESLDKFDANEINELRSAQAGGWNAYQQIKDNLIARGVPANEIRFIQEANNDEQKQAMFDAVNAGDIRVLIGSTPRMGAGTNAQERLVALHHVDVGWKPSDIEQREGRIVRQGNGFMDPERAMFRPDFEVEILAYATERTADAAMWALNGMKLKTINGIRKYDGSFTMEFEDDDSLSMAHMAALASGDPLLLERIKLVGEVDKLERQETAHRRKIIGLQDNIEEAERNIADIPAKITANEQRAAVVSGWESSMAEAAAKRSVEVEGKTYTSRFQAASAAMSAAKEQQGEDDAAKFAVTIAGKRITSKTGIENTLDEAFGDVEPIEATIDGKKVVSRAGLVRAVIDRARELAINLDKGASEGFDIGTTMGMKVVGDVERSSWGTGAYEVSFSVLDESGKMLATGKAYGQAATHDFSHQFVRASVDRLFTGGQARDYKQTVETYRFALDRRRRELPELKRQLAASGPFKHTIDLEQKRMRLAEVTRLLTVGGKDLKHIDDFGMLFIASPQTVGQDDFGQQIELSEGATVYSRNGGATGVPMADAKAIVAAIRAANPAAPAIHVHETLAQAPKALRDAINKAGAQGDVEAAFHEGEIHVFPRHMASVERMAFVVGHHEIRHYGLRSILGPRLGPVALSLWTTNPALRAAAQKVIDDGHATSRVLAIEEALADMPVADLEKLTGWGKVMAAIRNWLRGVAQRLREARFPALADAFEPARWTDNDVAALVSRAEGVSKGGSSPYRAGGTVFGRSMEQPDDAGRSAYGVLPRGQDEGAGGRAERGVDSGRPSSREVGDSRSGGSDLRAGVQRGLETDDSLLQVIRTGLTRRNLLLGAAAAAATNANAGTTLGKAKPVSEAVLKQNMPEPLAKLLRAGQASGTTNIEGAKAIKAAMQQISTSGPIELRALAAQIVGMLPADNVLLTVDDRRVMNAHGAVRYGIEGPHLMLFTAGGRTGMTYGTFMHESLHLAVLARYKTLSEGMVRNNDARWKVPAPAAAAQLEQLSKLWDEFEFAAKANPPKDEETKLSVSEAVGTPDEFFVRALTDPRLQAYMAGIEYEGRSMLQRFKDWVTGLFVRSGTRPSWLDAALLASTELNTAMGSDRGDFSRLRASNQFSSTQREAVFSRATTTTASAPGQLAEALTNLRAAKLPAGYIVNDFITSHGKLSWWHKSVGSMHNLAERNPLFKTVYDAAQDFLNDVSSFATEAADLAPRMLPKLDGLRDIAKAPLSAADTKAISDAIFQGTLNWTRDAEGNPVEEDDPAKAGIVWTDGELRDRFNMDAAQVGLYHEFRKATDKSLTDLGISDMLRYAGKDADAVASAALASGDVHQAARLIQDHLDELGQAAGADRAQTLADTAATVYKKANQIAGLIRRGYAPLTRFGNYTLDVTENGERVYFGLFETEREANAFARRLKGAYPQAAFTQGTLSQQAYKLFAGVSPETVELFGNMLGLESQGTEASDKAFQDYLKLAKGNRSAMKRLIHRKGVAGFSEDAGRVLAGFVYSNARQAAKNLHFSRITAATQAIADTKGQGQLLDSAVSLHQYITNPVEEAQKFKGLLFAQFLGGSLAAGLVNLSQTAMVTFPYLTQFGGVSKAAGQMKAALADATKWETGKKTTGDATLDAAIKKAEDDGIISPQEVHSLIAQAGGGGALKAGDGTKVGDLAAKGSNFVSKLMLLWGRPFALAEQFNRRVTFIAAYRTAVEQGMPNPAAFAEKTVVDTQFNYTKANRPQWARGAIGSTLFTFKTYSISYVELLSRMAGAGPEGRKAALVGLGMLFLASGLQGLPGADDLDDLIDGLLQRLGYNFNTKLQKREFFASMFGEGGARFIMSGASGLPGMPIDVAGRLGLGNLIPGTGLFTKKADHTFDVVELAGPAGSFAKQVFTAADKVSQGEVMGAGQALLPVAAANAVKAIDMASTGMYRDMRGRKVIDTDGIDATMKAIGFQPNDVARVQNATRDVQEMVALNKMREAEIADKWARGIFEQNPKLAEEARAELARWNDNNPTSRINIGTAQLLKRIQSMRQDKITRITKTAPAEMRASVRRELEGAQQ